MHGTGFFRKFEARNPKRFIMDFAQTARAVFDRAVEEYHRHDDVDFPAPSPFALGSPEAVFFAKCWIDAVQWHLEDLIRDPG